MIRELAITYLPRKAIVPNPWNPNAMDEDTLAKERASIVRFGMFDPILVRPAPGGTFEIIDGEQRWKSTPDPMLPCIVTDCDDLTAQQITIIANELRGQPVEERLKALLAQLSAEIPVAELIEVMPFDESAFASVPEVDWNAIPEPESFGDRDTWTERIYRLPLDAAKVVDAAIERLIAQEDVPEWRALELICADYLGT